MLTGIAHSYLFGLVIAMSVGPIALLIFNYGLAGGWQTSAPAAMGAAVADFLYAIVAFTLGVQIVASLTDYQVLIRILSSSALVGIGAWMIWGAINATPSAARTANSPRPFLTTLGLTTINPLTITVFMSFAVQLPQTSSTVSRLLFAASVFVGSLCGQLIFAATGAVGAKLFTKPEFIRLISIASGGGIVVFGVLGFLRLMIGV